MSMLSSFFDISKESKDLFKRLKISEDKELCERWVNRFPPIFVSFKDVDGLTFESAYDRLCSIISDLFYHFRFLLSSSRTDDIQKEKFNRIYRGEGSREDVVSSLRLLVTMLHVHYGNKVILLIDEYDVPMAKASARGYYDEMIDLMRGVLGVLKDNDALNSL